MIEQSREAHPNALPNYQSAVIPREKLEKYALNPKHVSRLYGSSSGQDKAQVFKRALKLQPDSYTIKTNLAKLSQNKPTEEYVPEEIKTQYIHIPVIAQQYQQAA
ncbi:MAG: DUF6883 domain-containing protein [Pyrinomonadaceae bacterium]